LGGSTRNPQPASPASRLDDVWLCMSMLELYPIVQHRTRRLQLNFNVSKIDAE
jgi:hypothetical protein